MARVASSPTDDAVRSSGGGDEELLLRLKAGEAAAYEAMVRELSPRLFAVARRMMGNEEDAADALQDAFISAFHALGTFDGRSRLSTWMHRIVVNACLMKLRKSRRRGEKNIESLLPAFQEDGHAAKATARWDGGALADAERSDMARIVHEKIDELPEAYRTVLLLRDIEQLDTEETARLLGESASSVKTRLHRARQALRELLDPYMTGGSI